MSIERCSAQVPKPRLACHWSLDDSGESTVIYPQIRGSSRFESWLSAYFNNNRGKHMTKDLGERLSAVTIESKRIARELERLWNRYYDIKLGKVSPTHLLCDACEDDH